jgi:hypothetical protein
MVQVSTCQYMPVRTDLGITDVSTYCLVPICGFLYGLVSTSVRTGSYQYIPPCTTLYQGYRIPDVRIQRRNQAILCDIGYDIRYDIGYDVSIYNISYDIGYDILADMNVWRIYLLLQGSPAIGSGSFSNALMS